MHHHCEVGIDVAHPESDGLEAEAEAAAAFQDGYADRLKEALLRDAPRMLAEHRWMRRGFRRRLLRVWGPALDRCEVVTVTIRELPELDGSRLRTGSRAGALNLIQGRAIGVMEEVMDLARAGHPAGAHARARTLHELAVTAILLGEGDDALAERWFDHAVVQRAADATEYQRLVAKARYPPLDPSIVEGLKTRKAALRVKYGDSFLKENGWAAELVAAYVAALPPEDQDRDVRPHWRRLGEIARRDHLRSYYRLACHHVHGGSHGTALNVYERAGSLTSLTGGTNAGLAEPVSEALGHLANVAVVYLLAERDDVDGTMAENVAVAEVLLQLVDRADEALEAAERRVAMNEVSYQRPLSLRHLKESARWVGIRLNGRARNGYWRMRARLLREVFR